MKTKIGFEWNFVKICVQTIILLRVVGDRELEIANLMKDFNLLKNI